LSSERVYLDDFNAIPSGPIEAVAPGAPKRLQLRPLADVQPRQVRWLLPGLIPLGGLTLVAGIGGLGKSTWLAGVAARVSRGELNGGDPGDVVLVSFEDPAAEVLRPRVEAAQGDLARVHEIVVDGAIDPVCLPRDTGELEQLVRGLPSLKLIVVDPVVAAIDTKLSAHNDQHVRSVLTHLSDLAEECELAIAMVGHLNKTPSKDAYIRIANSVAFYNGARSAVLITEDAAEPESQRIIAQHKQNWARRSPVERHRIEEIVLPETLDPVTGQPIVTSRMEFLELADDVDRDEVLAPRVSDDGDEKTARAVVFLVRALADGDWHDSDGLKRLAGAQQIKERTLQRAAGPEHLDVEHKRRFQDSTLWRLPHPRQGLTPTAGADGESAWLSEKDPPSTPSAPVPTGGVDGETNGRFCDGCTTERECAELHSCRRIEEEAAEAQRQLFSQNGREPADDERRAR
jgi:hypothetical protein